MANKEHNLMHEGEYAQMFKVESGHWWYRGLRTVLKRVLSTLKPESKVLDVGCGTGINMQMMEQMGLTAEGIDASPAGVEFCRLRGLDQVNVGLAQKLEFDKQSFDAVTIMDVLVCLHLDTIDTTFHEVNRVLKPNGLLIINSATLNWLYSAHDYVSGTVKRYGKHELEVMLEAAGFTVERSTYRVFFLFLPMVVSKLLRKVDPKKVNEKLDIASGDLERTSWLINTLLTPIMWLENLLLKSINMPIGTSVWIVARKK